MKEEKKLSVIIPIYNVEKYLDRCLKSIVEQTYRNLEIILIDDGSSDHSKEICELWETKDGRVRVYSQTNSGVSAARNMGFGLCSGDAIIFIDSDDEIEEVMFEKMIYRLFEFEDIDMVCCGYTNEFQGIILERKPKEGVLSNTEIMEALFDNCFMTAVWNKMFRKEILFDEEGKFISFSTQIFIGEDFLWLTMVLRRCKKIYCIGEVFYHWYRRKDSATRGENVVRTDAKALSEIVALGKISEICKDISSEVYYLSSSRYFGALMSKLKTKELFKNEKSAIEICYRMKQLINDFPIKTLHDFLKIKKAQFLLILEDNYIRKILKMGQFNKVGDFQMYKISSIISLREIQRQPFRDVVYEWEDYISIHDNILINNQKNVSITTHSNPSIYKKIESYLIKKQVCRRIDFSKPICIAFITMIKDIVYIQDKNCIPIFLDIWNKEIDFLLYKMRKGSPFFVTSMDVYQKVKEKKKTANVHYIPLTVSDKWVTNDEIKKTLDILQVGRKNQVLHEYALKYISTHPNIEYVYSGENGTNGDLEYYSTKGRSIKPAKTRTDYMELLKSANICLLSSPGADASRKWAEDIDFPTPRFYETAVAQCHMIARLTDRLEFKEQGITDICKIVDNYESFEKILDEILSSGKKIDREIYSQFINRHVTSNWYVMLKKKLEVLQ